MKYLLVLIILALLLFFIYRRLRPYLATARHVLGILRSFKNMGAGAANSEPLRTASRGGERLVRCASCETWIPAAQAVRLRSSKAYYCSHTCLENAAEKQVRRQKKTMS
ncbi:MAG TPA: hypothetical protein VGB17_13315 [Pyrinomonadaceae bacterium]